MINRRVKLFAEGIITAEGWLAAGFYPQNPGGSRSYRNHNPGNLRSSIFEINNLDGFSVFIDDEIGRCALFYQLYLYLSGKSTSGIGPNTKLEDFVSLYANLKKGTDAHKNYLSVLSKFSILQPGDPLKKLLLP